MELIGLMGPLRAGKDTSANYFVSEHGFTRVAFADKMRHSLYTLDPVVFATYGDETIGDHRRLKWVVDKYGWDGIKSTYYNDEVRRLMQRFGTEVGRELLGENVWVDQAFKSMTGKGKYVVSDVRFPNECEAILAAGGIIIKITRKAAPGGHTHISENALQGFLPNYEIPNNGTIEELETKLGACLADWREYYQ